MEENITNFDLMQIYITYTITDDNDINYASIKAMQMTQNAYKYITVKYKNIFDKTY